MPWTDLCQVDASGTPLRIIAPSDHVASNPDAFSDYFTDHTNEVWTYYSTNTLTIDTQAAAGKVACTVQGDQLTCAGDNRGQCLRHLCLKESTLTLLQVTPVP